MKGEDTIKHMELKVSVIIPTKNRVYDLEECIESLINQIYSIDELVVVDGSNDNETENCIRSLKEKNLNFDCVYLKQTKGGMAHARNIGIDYASGDVIIFIDDDVILDKRYMEEIVTVFANDKNKEIGGVGGKAEEKGNNKILHLFYPIFGIIFLRDSWKKGSVTISGHHTRLPDEPSYVEWLDGKSMAYRKNVLAEFRDDERLEILSPYAYYEDLDLSYRIGKKYKLFLNPKAKAIHKASPSSRPDFFKTNSIKIQNHYYFIKKHKFSKVAFWWSTFGLLLVHIILLIIQPCKKNYLALKGITDGMTKIVLCNIQRFRNLHDPQGHP
jgi:GT2 family glycosyltransferase